MRLIRLISIVLALVMSPARADSDQEIEMFLVALQAENYKAAAEVLAYPVYDSEQELSERKQEVLEIISGYHELLGKLEEVPAKGSISGTKSSLGISGGTEEFAMENPASDFRLIPARFSRAGVVYLTFMLSDYQGETRIVYMQYDYVEQ